MRCSSLDSLVKDEIHSKSLALKNGKKAWVPHSRTTSLSLSLSLKNTHTPAHLSTKLSRYTFTNSTHTLMLNWHRGVSHADGMLCSEELTQAPNIKWTQAFYISSSNSNWQQKPWNMMCDKKKSIYEICHVAVATLNAHDKNTLAWL